MRMSNGLYNVLRDVAQIYLPAFGTLYVALAEIWGLPSPQEVSATVLAIDTALGTVLKISSTLYQKSDARFDGLMETVDTEDGTNLHLRSIDPAALLDPNKHEVVFKLQR